MFTDSNFIAIYTVTYFIAIYTVCIIIYIKQMYTTKRNSSYGDIHVVLYR